MGGARGGGEGERWWGARRTGGRSKQYEQKSSKSASPKNVSLKAENE